MKKLFTPREILAMAQKRYDIHEQFCNQTERFYRDVLREDYIGLFGEIAFGNRYDIMEYWTGPAIKPYGDNGIDFDIPEFGTIDIKTAQKPNNLLEKQGKVGSDYYVLLKYFIDDTVGYIGWHHGSLLSTIIPKDKGGKGILSHYIHYSELLNMNQFPLRRI